VNYQEALDYLTSLGRFGIKLGLERTDALLHALGDPQDLFQGVHVAGTNGKGSVCAMLASVLQSAGYRVGLMPKPRSRRMTSRPFSPSFSPSLTKLRQSSARRPSSRS